MREQFTPFELLPIGIAISQLGEAIYADKDRAIQAAANALSKLNEFIGNACPCPELTKEESQCMISEDRSTRIWYQFVKIVAERSKQEKPKNFTGENILEAIRRADSTPLTTDDIIFLDLLSLWPDFNNAVETVKDWNSEPE